MPVLTARDRIIRVRWQAFLKPVVGKGRAVTPTALDKARRQLTGNPSDGRALIYSHIAGTQTVRPPQAFEIGESLRACGLEWSSGPVALYLAGHLADFVGVLGSLSLESPASAVRLLYGAAVFEADLGIRQSRIVEVKGRVAFQKAIGGRSVSLPNAGMPFALARDRASKIAAEELARAARSFGAPSTELWDRWGKRKTARGYPFAFQLALTVSKAHDALPFERLEEGIIVLLDRLWTRANSNRELRTIAEQLRFATLAADPDDILSVPEIAAQVSDLAVARSRSLENQQDLIVKNLQEDHEH